jgi:hypothetical protein
MIVSCVFVGVYSGPSNRGFRAAQLQALLITNRGVMAFQNLLHHGAEMCDNSLRLF